MLIDNRQRDRDAGRDGEPFGNADISASIGQHRPPTRNRRRDADPEEAQGRFGHDVARDREARDHDDRAPDVRQDVLEQDTPAPLASGPGGQHEFVLLDRQDLAPHDAAVLHPAGQSEHQDELVEPLPSTAMMASASRMVGNDSWMSAMRMMTSSTRPPKNPETKPRSNPIVPEISTAESPTISETRAP